VSAYRTLASSPGADRETSDKALQRLSRFYTDTNQRQKLDAVVRSSNGRSAGSSR
jgi:hypothetical protein